MHSLKSSSQSFGLLRLTSSPSRYISVDSQNLPISHKQLQWDASDSRLAQPPCQISQVFLIGKIAYSHQWHVAPVGKMARGHALAGPLPRKGYPTLIHLQKHRDVSVDPASNGHHPDRSCTGHRSRRVRCSISSVDSDTCGCTSAPLDRSSRDARPSRCQGPLYGSASSRHAAMLVRTECISQPLWDGQLSGDPRLLPAGATCSTGRSVSACIA